MIIIEEQIGDVIVEVVNLDRATLKEAEELKEKLTNKINYGFKKIVVDLSQCEFVDSTFLGVLVNGLKKVARVDGDLRLVGFKPAVQSMFELTRMFRVFQSFEDVKEAVSSFNG